MKKLSLIIALLLLPVTTYATPTSWDYSANTLQPLQSQQSALVKAHRFQATSTIASIFPFASTTSITASATSTFSNGLNIGSGYGLQFTGYSALPQLFAADTSTGLHFDGPGIASIHNGGIQTILFSSTNKVGIGTSSPSQLLSVQGNSIISGDLSLANLTATGTATINGLASLNGNASTTSLGVTGSIFYTTDPDTGVSFANNSTRLFASNNYVYWSGSAFYPLNTSVRDLGIDGTNVWNKLFVNYASTTGITSTGSAYLATVGGNVGIATTSPTSKLTLGSGQLELPIGSVAAPSLAFNGDLNTGIYGDGSDTILFGTSANRRFFIDQNFAASSGSGPRMNSSATSGTAPAFVPNRTDTTTGIGASAAGALSFITAGTTKIEITNAGLVGIGTTSPYSKLSVVGDVVAARYVATTTATSTFAGGVQAPTIDLTSTTATSTAANGINLTGGCFSIAGVCVGGSSGGAVDVQTFTSTAGGTWNRPASGTVTFVGCWGAGGGGGRDATYAGGGGGGAFVSALFDKSALGSTEAVGIGTGGAGVSSDTVGGNGGNSTFGSWLIAYGGGGGGPQNNSAGGGGGGGAFAAGTQATASGNATGGSPLGGAGGLSQASPTAGGDNSGGGGGGGGGSDINAGTGAGGGASMNGGGGGGGGAASGGNTGGAGGASMNGGGGGGGSGGTGGAGGNSYGGGDGGAGGSAGASNGAQPGGGGGGSLTGTSGSGGDGKCVVITY